MPDSGSVQRRSIAPTAARAASHPAGSNRPLDAAQAKSRSASPKASNWNWLADPVPDDIGPARIPGHTEGLDIGNGPAVGKVRRAELVTVSKEAGSYPAHGVIEHRLSARNDASGSPDVATVADPHVAVVVVPVAFGPFRQRCRRRGDGSPLGAGHAAEERIGPPNITGGDHPLA